MLSMIFQRYFTEFQLKNMNTIITLIILVHESIVNKNYLKTFYCAHISAIIYNNYYEHFYRNSSGQKLLKNFLCTRLDKIWKLF
jgi:hypothetical protein